MKESKKTIGKALGLVLVMTLLCGVVYTAVITFIGNVFFNDKANGSIIEVNGVNFGSELLAQQFNDEDHMWGRIMNLNLTTYQDEEGNWLMYSGPSNLSPNGQDLKAQVDERVEMILAANPEAASNQIPVDLVTNSGSGLDPHISAAAAQYQVPRLAAHNNMTEDEVRAIIEKCTKHKILGIFGEETVNVLKVNLMLEGILP